MHGWVCYILTAALVRTITLVANLSGGLLHDRPDPTSSAATPMSPLKYSWKHCVLKLQGSP